MLLFDRCTGRSSSKSYSWTFTFLNLYQLSAGNLTSNTKLFADDTVLFLNMLNKVNKAIGLQQKLQNTLPRPSLVIH